MVMLFHSLLRARRGQSRILEAAIAAVIISIVFSVSTFLIRSSDVRVLQERADLDRLGYNVLQKIVESGIIEKTLDRWPEPGFGEALLKPAVQRSLPSTIYYDLRIFDCTEDGSWVQLTERTSPKNRISNTSVDSFPNSLEVSSTSIIYTSQKGNIYHLVLLLARAGGL